MPIGAALLWFSAFDLAQTSGRRDIAEVLFRDVAAPTGARLAALAAAAGVNPETRVASSSIDPSTVPLVRAAVPIAARVNSGVVRQRHLLAAAALEPDSAETIEHALGWAPGDARRLLRNAIAAVLPQEFPDTWDEILLAGQHVVEAPAAADDAEPEDVEDVLDTDLSDDAVGADARIPLDHDSLGLGTYVTMLAAAIAREDTPLPLSIGLFGEWGSGKSYFMGLLRQQIDTLSASDNGAYLTGIEQITFNAWHYSDANLWASLGTTIFERLGTKTPSIAARRRDLEASITTTAVEVESVRTEVAGAEAASALAQAELDLEREKLGRSPGILLSAVARTDRVQADAAKAWKTLGVDDELEQARLLTAEARGLWGDLVAVSRVFRGATSWLLMATVVLALLVLGAAVLVPDGVRQALAGTSIAALTGAAVATTVILKRARGAVRTLADVANAARANADQLIDEKVAPLQQRVDVAARTVEELTANRTSLEEKLQSGQTELAALAPDRQWYDFVAERVASNDYRPKLGLISTIRRDFERLIELMKDWRSEEKSNPLHRPINRIVLYIDDLDRCSPRQVMDVLQAVHLILALDLFVVVVGVDPRWLLQSLRQQYRDNFAEAGGGTPSEEDWAAEPLDYLEKIFNIPFVLPRMTGMSFRALIEKMSTDSDLRADRGRSPDPEPARPAPGPSREDGETTDAAPPPVDGRNTSDAPPVAVQEITAQSGSEVADAMRGKPTPGMGLTGIELFLLARLAPVVESPRQAKRLLNIYRMLRSLRDVGSSTEFLSREGGGGDYQALAILLGVLTARPSLFGDLLWAPAGDGYPGGICGRPSTGTWSAVVEGLKPRGGPNGFHNDLGSLTEDAVVQWRDLLTRLDEATGLVSLADLSAFQTWGPYVARFSFALSPLAATVTANPGAATA